MNFFIQINLSQSKFDNDRLEKNVFTTLGKGRKTSENVDVELSLTETPFNTLLTLQNSISSLTPSQMAS